MIAKRLEICIAVECGITLFHQFIIKVLDEAICVV